MVFTIEVQDLALMKSESNYQSTGQHLHMMTTQSPLLQVVRITSMYLARMKQDLL